MAQIRSQNEIVLSLLDFFRAAQPDLDTKPGQVSRDVLVDGVAIQLARLYEELQRNAALSSLRLALGSDLDRLASNYGAVRKRGTKSAGPALFTFEEIVADIGINSGNIVTARNGATFIVSTNAVVSPVFVNSYRALATRYRADLDLVGITDEFAIEVQVEGTATGVQGNVSKYILVSTDIDGVSHVTNVTPFGGGSAPEDDATFRSRVLAIFSGANTGTALGYRNAVLSDPAVLDAIVIQPGDSLMVRDGTQVGTDSDGNTIVISEGTGGKVDIYVYGTRLLEVLDSYVYNDLSNTDDPTNTANDFVLGQIDGDELKTVTQRRLDNLQQGVLPAQPANNIVSVSGSISGANFVPKSVDSLGRISGNYELVVDTGAFGGSPWGFDKMRWISSYISNYPEDVTKGVFNGQDALSFPDVLEIGTITQNVSVVNENSTVSRSDRSSIQLKHSPMTNVTRVFNPTTGERYVVESQNPDGTGAINETGRIVISGSSLPAVSDTLQVDYTWMFHFDPWWDYDNGLTIRNPRTVNDSVDWGFSNAVRREQATLVSSGSVLLATVTHPISTVIDVNVFEEQNVSVSLVSGRLAIVVNNSVENVVGVVDAINGAELWNTSDDDGSFSGFTIFLPTDTSADFGDVVTAVYNAVDVYNVDGYQGSFNSNQITIVPSVTAVAGEIVEVNYLANVNIILPATPISSLPAIRSGNNFDTVVSSGVGNQPTTHLFSGSGVIEKNLRQAPSRLALAVAGSISSGVFTISGTTMVGVFDAVYTVGTEGLTLNLASALRRELGLASSASIPSNLSVARVVSVEKVDATINLDVLSVTHTYDTLGCALRDNSFVKDEAIINTALGTTEVTLPDTADNQSNEPQVGDRLRVTFYYTLTSDTENVSFSQSGTLRTEKIFAIIDSIAVSSGFSSTISQSATLTITNINQPTQGTRYKSYYDYTAPQPNERITVRYNYNKLISDSTLNIENTRPITADVLGKASFKVLVDVTMNIVVTTSFENNSEIVKQNVQNAVSSALTATQLGTTVDSSDLVVVAQQIDGVDRARILFFNKADEAGTVLSITAAKNEFLVANDVIVTVETR